MEERNYTKGTVSSSQLAGMRVKEISILKKRCIEEQDVLSLLNIEKHYFSKGAAASNEYHFPAMCYYYGRLQQGKELQEYLKDKDYHILVLSDSCKELAQNLLKIGNAFPHLSVEALAYLDDKYSDPATFEVLDYIMFDSNLLSRPIKKFDIRLLKTVNSNFSRDFLLLIYSCFLKNEELDLGYDDIFVYSRITNQVISKTYQKVGLGEICIIQPIHSNELCSILNERYGSECVDYFARHFTDEENMKDFINSDFYSLTAESIEVIANKFFGTSAKINDLKAEIAKHWLSKANS